MLIGFIRLDRELMELRRIKAQWNHVFIEQELCREYVVQLDRYIRYGFVKKIWMGNCPGGNYLPELLENIRRENVEVEALPGSIIVSMGAAIVSACKRPIIGAGAHLTMHGASVDGQRAAWGSAKMALFLLDCEWPNDLVLMATDHPNKYVSIPVKFFEKTQGWTVHYPTGEELAEALKTPDWVRRPALQHDSIMKLLDGLKKIVEPDQESWT